eukprot:1190936-Prorocentrum_minimum.AAC.2
MLGTSSLHTLDTSTTEAKTKSMACHSRGLRDTRLAGISNKHGACMMNTSAHSFMHSRQQTLLNRNEWITYTLTLSSAGCHSSRRHGPGALLLRHRACFLFRRQPLKIPVGIIRRMNTFIPEHEGCAYYVE